MVKDINKVREFLDKLPEASTDKDDVMESVRRRLFPNVSSDALQESDRRQMRFEPVEEEGEDLPVVEFVKSADVIDIQSSDLGETDEVDFEIIAVDREEDDVFVVTPMEKKKKGKEKRPKKTGKKASKPSKNAVKKATKDTPHKKAVKKAVKKPVKDTPHKKAVKKAVHTPLKKKGTKKPVKPSPQKKAVKKAVHTPLKKKKKATKPVTEEAKVPEPEVETQAPEHKPVDEQPQISEEGPLEEPTPTEEVPTPAEEPDNESVEEEQPAEDEAPVQSEEEAQSEEDLLEAADELFE